ncbi:MAG: peptide ABC transporter substrate-binding protein [Chloroflexi bacterium]|nr:peptide ABC transporter substrate-binding protein [Chloroflexota bacterium]
MLGQPKKLLVMISTLIIVALALSACGAAPAPTPAPPPAATATTAPAVVQATATAVPPPPATPTKAAPVAGACGSLKILYWQAATILNPHLAQGTKDFDASRLVLEPLAAMNPDGVPVPVLAAEVPTIANGGAAKDFTTITWKLKQGVKWSDGTDFTADDVIFTYNYASDEKTAVTTADSFSNIKTIEAPDKFTVKITWKDPNPNFYEAFVTGLGTILQKKQFEAFSGAKAKDGPNLKPVGTGPFMVREMKPDDVVTYDMNPNYRDFKNGKPCFKDVTFKGGGDAPSAAKAVFQTGEADYGWNLQVEASVLVPMANAADSKGILATAPGPNLERLLVNRTNPDASLGDKRSEPGQPHPFLSDLKVRQALAMVIDTTEMAKQLYGPAGDGACQVFATPKAIVSPNIKCSAVTADTFAAANKLLDDAGWAKGSDGIRHKTVGGKDVKMNIVYQTTVNSLRQKEQAFVKDAWEKLGTKVELKSVPAGVYFSSDEANPDTAAKFFTDIEMFTSGPESPDPTNYLKGWTCGEIKTKAGKWSGNNYERACNKDYDALFDQLTKETDAAKRNDLAIKMNELIIKDVVIIPLVARKSVSGYSKALKGIIFNGWDSEEWNIADWAK